LQKEIKRTTAIINGQTHELEYIWPSFFIIYTLVTGYMITVITLKTWKIYLTYVTIYKLHYKKF